MRNKIFPILLAFVFGLCLLMGTWYGVSNAAPLTQTGGQTYIVQRGDSLYGISQKVYGNPAFWPQIVAATNVKAEEDSSYTAIIDPRIIRVNQRLWIPDVATMQGGPVEEAAIFFEELLDGATVSPTFQVLMGATGLTVEPAGEIREGAGHMHILIDTDFVPGGEIIGNDEQHLHFGQGQLTTTLELEPGEHTLRLQFANGGHFALDGPQYQDTVTVMVEEAPGEAADIFFVDPLDGATVPSSFEVVMGATGLTVEPAGEIREGAGHMHILIDTDFVPGGEIIGNDEQHLHFGKGQLTTTLELEPGEHTLRLQFANGGHFALDGPQYQDTVTVIVEN